jgi:hypothetical protein
MPQTCSMQTIFQILNRLWVTKIIAISIQQNDIPIYIKFAQGELRVKFLIFVFYTSSDREFYGDHEYMFFKLFRCFLQFEKSEKTSVFCKIEFLDFRIYLETRKGRILVQLENWIRIHIKNCFWPKALSVKVFRSAIFNAQKLIFKNRSKTFPDVLESISLHCLIRQMLLFKSIRAVFRN